MSIRLAPAPPAGGRTAPGPVHRSIVAVDLERSTARTNPERGELRRVLYALLDRALRETGIAPEHREEPVDRGDGALILIRPDDALPKTLLLGRLIPTLAALLAEHNAAAAAPELRMRVRAVVHAGEVHSDDWGFYGEDLDLAFRLLDAPPVKRALREAAAAPLVLVVSQEIFTAIVRHGYLRPHGYEPLVHVRVADRRDRGWVRVPVPVPPGSAPVAARRPALEAGRRASAAGPQPVPPTGPRPLPAAALERTE
ncbi:hypothetical protein [Actinomadura hibisca]|uniref:hypothetical protein n=1 Tax=Actinomadura hibisca TaxID=68565 RepID=UPI00082DBD59|nr:hypothetical protein [Actinomadura hibisca]